MLNHITMFQPSAIDNAFSTLQIIHKLIKHMNKVIDEVNSIDSKANEYTDEQIRLAKNELNTRIDEVVLSITELETELKQFARDYTDTQIDDLKNEYIHNKLVEVYEAIENVNDRLTTLYERLDIKIDRTKNELEYLIEITKAELMELIKKGGSVYSGVTGELTNAEKTVKQLVDKVQHKNGVEWNDIITQISSQFIFPNGYYEYTDSTTNVKVRIGKEIKPLLTDYDSDPTMWWSEHNSPIVPNAVERGIGITFYSNNVVTSIKMNGVKLSFYNISNYEELAKYISNSTVNSSGVYCVAYSTIIPLLASVNSGDYIPQFYSNTYEWVPLKRINKLEINTFQGETFIIPFEFTSGTSLNFEIPTYDDIISSCSTNKKWNTWDTLTYYTIKFLNEHCDNGNYKIPFSNENEILFNNSGDIKGFYDNKSS